MLRVDLNETVYFCRSGVLTLVLLKISYCVGLCLEDWWIFAGNDVSKLRSASNIRHSKKSLLSVYWPFETSAAIYQSHWRNIPEDLNPQLEGVLPCSYKSPPIQVPRKMKPVNTLPYSFEIDFNPYPANVENMVSSYRGADKSLARQGRKQATATKLLNFASHSKKKN